MATKPPKQPDRADRIAARIAKWTHTWHPAAFKSAMFDLKLAARIRRAIRDAVKDAMRDGKVERWSDDDELVATGRIHIERMTDSTIWIGVGDESFLIGCQRATVSFWSDDDGAQWLRKTKGPQ